MMVTSNSPARVAVSFPKIIDGFVSFVKARDGSIVDIALGVAVGSVFATCDVLVKLGLDVVDGGLTKSKCRCQKNRIS